MKRMGVVGNRKEWSVVGSSTQIMSLGEDKKGEWVKRMGVVRNRREWSVMGSSTQIMDLGGDMMGEMNRNGGKE